MCFEPAVDFIFRPSCVEAQHEKEDEISLLDEKLDHQNGRGETAMATCATQRI